MYPFQSDVASIVLMMIQISGDAKWNREVYILLQRKAFYLSRLPVSEIREHGAEELSFWDPGNLIRQTFARNYQISSSQKF